MTSSWTAPEDIAARVRRRWDDGSLLRALAGDESFAGVEVPLRGPKASEIGDNIEAVRAWVARLDAGRRDDRRYALQWGAIGGRQIGRNQIPVRAVVTTLEQAWELLGVGREVRGFSQILEISADYPAVRAWVCSHPHRALDIVEDMPRIVAAYTWLDEHRGAGIYLREISAPGVDTKFAERHRPVLAQMLQVPSTASGFVTGLGLRLKPDFVRLRPASSLGLPVPLSEVVARVDEVSGLALTPTSALVIENEITYLSVDVPHDGVVIWGKGFDVDRVGRLPWLAGTDVRYWGDIDTHGFAILDRLRAWLPEVRSVLMDRDTLLAHRDRWGRDERPTKSALSRLVPFEQDLYEDLVSDVHGERVRLEQERIDWAWACDHLIG